MNRTSPRCFALLVAAMALAPTGALAQMTPGMGGGGMGGGGMGGGGMGAGPGPEKKEEEQAAEQAPTSPEALATEQLPPAYPAQQEKKLQFIELHGYMRGRAYLFHNLNLGVPLTMSGPVPPFYVPYSEFGATGMASNPGNSASCAGRTGSDCTASNITSADMRLRLEPIVTVTDQVKVYAQIDIFDDLVAGSTPEGFFINGFPATRDVPAIAFTRTQVPPTAGQNAVINSIVAKRAWAEVKTPIGLLSFGRMPSHWGMGMFVNKGDCLDCDYGVNVDRIMFATKVWNHFFAFMYDWAATGPTTSLYHPNQQVGQSFNADPLTSVWQLALALGRRDDPAEIKERVDRGRPVFNYGGYFVYRNQAWDETNPSSVPVTPAQLGASGTLGSALNPRNAWAFIPDIWLRLNWRKLQLELEAVGIIGRIGNVSDLDNRINHGYDIREFGGVFRADYRLLAHDSLHLGVEIGYASGDPGEDPNGVINYRYAQIVRPPEQTVISNFQFDPDYHVDLILFRQLLGTVTNATYFKPNAAYDILDNLSARVDIIYSLANQPVGYPGNAVNLGLELDGSVMYHNEEEGFYAGVAYGVLFPFAALSLPGGTCDPKDVHGCEIYGPGTAHSAETAQTVQARLVVKF